MGVSRLRCALPLHWQRLASRFRLKTAAPKRARGWPGVGEDGMALVNDDCCCDDDGDDEKARPGSTSHHGKHTKPTRHADCTAVRRSQASARPPPLTPLARFARTEGFFRCRFCAAVLLLPGRRERHLAQPFPTLLLASTLQCLFTQRPIACHVLDPYAFPGIASTRLARPLTRLPTHTVVLPEAFPPLSRSLLLCARCRPSQHLVRAHALAKQQTMSSRFSLSAPTIKSPAFVCRSVALTSLLSLSALPVLPISKSFLLPPTMPPLPL
ncbi:hypothetical protein BS50DRAFT_61230 [Corynespora cassiicola Philippines]|uniref:Uncharacterized protein n=1 Tax=Corynespora cassiicola Philippines TaxID=1448308 RepID=A0A2T2NKI3_CORCC|nr:hypothetical protein BS50DRAFT_61230 [Corynespora cassiicola Philippines]